ncbi:MAG: hypothetical protein IT270_05700 [Saprospiraceae bacterium]|nr:hypothetical protein [Saprospiraceae bacterium]
MQKTAILLLLFIFTQCTVESPPLDLNTYDIVWTDADSSGTNTTADYLRFNIALSASEPHLDDQYINEYEFSYTVNSLFGGFIRQEKGLLVGSVSIDEVVVIEALTNPGGGEFMPGDRIQFRFWGIDNHATQVERNHTFVVE